MREVHSTISFHLPVSLIRALKREAELRGESRSAIAREAIRAYLDQQPKASVLAPRDSAQGPQTTSRPTNHGR